MNATLLQKLQTWRKREAARRGVELYRVLPNDTLDEIAQKEPTTKEELLDVKGIAEKKYEMYGKDILGMVSGATDGDEGEDGGGEDPVSVSEYLNRINRVLAKCDASVYGEVTQIQEKYGNYYMTLTDPDDESSMDCFIKGRDYDIAGVDVEEGVEVEVTGFPSVYKKYGRFSLRVTAIELVGEGALKKAYEKLKKKLSEEGLFDAERKKDIPSFVQSVGLITSRGSDAYHDVVANLGTYGFKVAFFPSRVQGGRAVKELLRALRHFKENDVDVVIVTRGGGGDLEVLQAFNNENVVRLVADMDIPVIAGIGHEKDVPLTSLAADIMVSTPTGAAERINRSWKNLEKRLDRFAQEIPAQFSSVLRRKEHMLERLSQQIDRRFRALTDRVDEFKHIIQRAVDMLGHEMVRQREALDHFSRTLFQQFTSDLKEVRTSFKAAAKRLEDADPRKALERGYSIVRSKDGIVRSVDDVSTDEEIEIRVSDGTIGSHITNISKQDDHE